MSTSARRLKMYFSFEFLNSGFFPHPALSLFESAVLARFFKYFSWEIAHEKPISRKDINAFFSRYHIRKEVAKRILEDLAVRRVISLRRTRRGFVIKPLPIPNDGVEREEVEGVMAHDQA